MVMFFDPVKLISNSKFVLKLVKLISNPSFALKTIYVLNIKTTFRIITDGKVKQEHFFLKVDSPQSSVLQSGTANVPIKRVN